MTSDTFIGRALVVIGLVAISTDPAYAIDLQDVLVTASAYVGAIVAFLISVLVAAALGWCVVRLYERRRP